jgi:hypothetical protein
MSEPERIEAAILHLSGERGEHKSICPSEVARTLDADWRPLMGRVRIAAIRLARAGRIDILRHGKPVAPDEVRGVIRLRIRAETTSPSPAAEG